MGLADDFLDDARDMATQSCERQRPSQMRRAISTAYYAVFHLFVEDFVEHWEFEDQRARLGRMFNHGSMRNASFRPQSKNHLSPIEKELIDVIASFDQLQKDRHRADYDASWTIVESDVRNSVALAEKVFAKWRKIKGEDVARHHLLSMFGAKSE